MGIGFSEVLDILWLMADIVWTHFEWVGRSILLVTGLNEVSKWRISNVFVKLRPIMKGWKAFDNLYIVTDEIWMHIDRVVFLCARLVLNRMGRISDYISQHWRRLHWAYSDLDGAVVEFFEPGMNKRITCCMTALYTPYRMTLLHSHRVPSCFAEDGLHKPVPQTNNFKHSIVGLEV